MRDDEETTVDDVQPNIPLLRKCIEWVEAEAAKPYDERLWRQTVWAVEEDCGTACCIAGYAVLAGIPGVTVVPPTILSGNLGLRVHGAPMDWYEAGQAALGLDFDEADELFNDYNTAEDLRRIAARIAASVGERL